MSEQIADYVRDLANTIAGQAEAISEGRTSGRPVVTAKLLASNAATLLAWLEQQEASGSHLHVDSEAEGWSTCVSGRCQMDSAGRIQNDSSGGES